jgi:hypothetical protein
VPHSAVSVNDGQHICRWSCKIVMEFKNSCCPVFFTVPYLCLHTGILSSALHSPAVFRIVTLYRFLALERQVVP